MNSSRRFGPERATPPPRSFGALLRQHRILAGLTQEALAGRAGLSTRAITDLERGVNRSPQPGTLDLLGEALQLSAEEQADFAAAARRAKLHAQSDPTPPLAPTSATTQPDGPPDKPPAMPDESDEPARLLDGGMPAALQAKQHPGQESALPQKYGPLLFRHTRASPVQGLFALLVLLVGTFGGLSYWQHWWPFGKSDASSTTPASCYVYAQPTHRGGTITFSTPGFFNEGYPASSNPWFVVDNDEIELEDTLWGSPYAIGPCATLLPDELTEIPTLANGDVSRDGLTVIMRLRHDLRWSDGQPMTADDFAYWLEVLQDPATKPSSTYGFDQIDSHQVLDAHTLVLHYKQAYGPSVYYLPMAAPKHVWGSIPHQELSQRDEVNLFPKVTSGPFKLESYVPGKSMTLVPNPYYVSTTLHRSVLDRLVYTSPPDVDTMISAFESGQTDFAEDFGLDANLKVAGLKDVKTAQTVGYTQLDFNLTNQVLQDLQVRKAIEEAIDRCKLITTVFQLPCERLRTDTILPSPSIAYDPTIKAYDFDLAQARKDMQIAGWNCASGICTRDGKTFPTLKLVTTDNSITRRQVTALIKQDLEALGVPIVLSYSPPPVLFNNYNVVGSLASGQYDLALFAQGFGIDNDANLASFDSKEIPSADYPNGSNLERVNDPLVDHYLNQARMTPDSNEQARIYKALQQQLIGQVYVIPLYQVRDYILVNPNIGNQQNIPFAGSLWNVGDWFLTQ